MYIKISIFNLFIFLNFDYIYKKILVGDKLYFTTINNRKNIFSSF